MPKLRIHYDTHHQPAPMPTEAEFRAVVDAANAGHRDAVEQLKTILDEQPHIWQNVGDMGKQAEERLVSCIAKDNQLMRESLQRELAAMRADLLGADPTRMERLLVDRVISSWLRLQYIDVMYPTNDGFSVAIARLVLQQRESAQRLLNSTQTALQTYRKLAPPKLKVAPATGRWHAKNVS